MKKQIYISIIVPTYNMLNKIKDLIPSIEKQRYDKNKFEVIVVDNGSTDGTSEYIRQRYPWIKLLYENIPDTYRARNKGISNTSGYIIAFTDADCKLDQNWLNVIQDNFKNYEIDAISGKFKHGSSFLEKTIALVNHPNSQGNKSYLRNDFGCGNSAIKAKILKEYYFPEVARGGDRLLSWKLYKKRYKILYQPNLIVYHRPDFTPRSLFKRMIAYGNNFIRTRRMDRTIPGGFLLKLKFLAPFLYAGIRLIIDSRNLLKYRKTLNINIIAMPFYIGTFIILRIIHLFGMLQELLLGRKK